MNVTIIIPVHNGADYLAPCLNAVLSQTVEPQHTLHVLAIENGSTDASTTILATDFSSVQTCVFEHALGFAGAANAGIRIALEQNAPDVVVLLNQDTEVHAGWLAALLTAFEADPAIGAAGSKAYFPDGRIQHAGGELLLPLGYGRNLGHAEDDYGQYDQPTAPDYLSGLSLALRVTMLTQIGFFDEGFHPAYYEDVDLCLRAVQAGWQLRYVPTSTLTHHEGAVSVAGDYAHAVLIERNRLRLLLKHLPYATLQAEFVAAEMEQIAQRAAALRVHVLRRAYLEATMMLADIAPQAAWRDQAEAVVAMLTDLRQHAAHAERDHRLAYMQQPIPVPTLPGTEPDPPPPTDLDDRHDPPEPEPPRVALPDRRPATAPPVSIIILTWNGLDYTRECLDSLRAYAAGADFNVIIVDNGSTDGTRDYLRSVAGITLIENETNEGYVRGNNRGIAAAPPDHDILLLNNDTRILHAGWLGRLREVAHSDPTYGIVGCRLLMDDGRLLHIGTYMPTHTFWGWQLGAGEDDIGQYPAVREVDGVVGACMYIRRDLIDHVGVLDEQFFSYFEDTDYCLRAIQAGYRVVCVGDVAVLHHENVSTTINRVSHSAMFKTSQQIFLAKWQSYYHHERYRQRLLWHSMVSAPSGYATSSRQLVVALDQQRVDVRLAYILGPDAHQPPSNDIRVEQLRERPKDTSVPQVVYFFGDTFHKNSGAYRIGYTMLEVTGLPMDWVRQANLMDEVWVPSHFNQETFRASGVIRPIHIIPLGVDPNYFHPQLKTTRFSDRFTFLSVFEWGERKAAEILLRAYTTAFTANDGVLLVLKIDNRDGSVNVAQAIADMQLPEDRPPILLLYNQTFHAYQMGSLYRAADCFVLPTRGEGWGMPIIEAMACGVPTIATNWSAQTDYMHADICYPLNVAQLVPAVAKCPYYAGYAWAEPDQDHLVYLMRHVYQQQHAARTVGLRGAAEIAARWTWAHAARRIIERLDAIG